MKTAIHIFLGIICLLIYAGCEGPEGPTGPKGKDGADGNANVVVTLRQVATWTLTNDGRFFIANVSVPAIDQNIITHGSVIIYYSIDNATWGLLPAIIASTPSGDVFVLDYVYIVGSVQLQAQNVEMNSASLPSSVIYLKIVTIASSYLGKNEINEISWNNNVTR